MVAIYLYYFLIIGLAILLAYWYGNKTKEWRWSEYFLLTLAPFSGLVFMIWLEGPQIILFFICSGLAGLFGEIIMGFFSEKILGKKLWQYEKLSIGGYTSWLTIPFWGGMGTVFWILARLLNL